jgi:hypothetical protein
VNAELAGIAVAHHLLEECFEWMSLGLHTCLLMNRVRGPGYTAARLPGQRRCRLYGDDSIVKMEAPPFLYVVLTQSLSEIFVNARGRAAFVGSGVCGLPRNEAYLTQKWEAVC